MRYPEYKSVNYADLADEILDFWQKNDIFQKSIEVREGSPSFTFYEGPPSANGTPGIHHVMARTIKDIFCRYKTLRGFQVKRKAGWDTHGLPVELQVEKELGITKEDIGKKITVAEYNQKCREAVMRFTDLWQDMTDKMGYWVDMEDPYITYKNEYIESIWYLLKELYKKGMLYKGYTIQPFSPAAGTGLSSHELNQPGCYRDVKDTSLTAQFKLIKNHKSEFLFDAAKGEVYVLAWTTTPWTLPSNSALTVGKNIDYVLVKTFNPYTYLPINVIIAKDLAGKYFTEKGKEGDFEGFENSDKKVIPWTIITEVKGSQLNGMEYEQLMPYVQPKSPAFRIIIGDFVTTEDGTGVVHTAPTFGADDFRVAQQHGIPAIMVEDESGKEMPLVDRKGRFVKEVSDYALEYVKEAYYSAEEIEEEKKKQGRDKYLSVDERIAIKLKTENKAFNVQKFDHPYPHCWRTDKPVLYYPLDSWFIRTTAAKEKLVELNKTINWQPESTGSGRFGNWLENLVDWNLSRSRYWGTPLPIWRSEDGEEVCIGSVKELIEAVNSALDSGKLGEKEAEKNREFLERYEASKPQVDEKINDSLNLTPSPSPEERGVSSEENRVNRVFRADAKVWLEKLKNYARENRKNPTESEDLIWQEVRNNKLGVKFRRQHAIEGYIVDFVCISLNLVIEIDGEIHDIEEQKIFDQAREEFLNYEGFKVIRFTNDEVKSDLNKVISSICEIIENLKKDSSYYSNKKTPLSPGEGQGVRSNELFDLHRPHVDEIYLLSPSGKVMYRQPDLIDVWFDSGAMPYAQWHYPFENQDIFDKSYPADFISEGVDQTRGWFFTLHAIAGMLFDSVAFKNVISTGLVLDKNGNKMSKRLGNAVDPFETLKKYGADPTRWYMITNAEPWDNLRFNIEGIQETQRKFFGTLTNTYNFFALYANLDVYQIEQFNRVPKEKLTELDRWIISKVNTLIKKVSEEFDNYNPTKAGRLVQDFVNDDLSNWYVRLNRRRFWQGELTDDKRGAYQTLQHCLAAVAQLMSPIAPFYAEWLYKNLTDGIREESVEKNTPFKYESVHFTEWAPYEADWVDADLEESMTLAQNICSMVHALRKKSGLKVRQPLQKILLPVFSEKVKKQIEHVIPIIKSEVNIKSVEFLDDESGVLKKKVKANFKTLGPKYGKDMKAVADAISGMDAATLKNLENEGKISLNGFNIELTDVEILTEDIPGWLVTVEGGLTVALDIHIDEALKQEGIARDFVNRIQNLRKDSGFEVTDKIVIKLKNNNQELADAVDAFKDYIGTEVQALSIEIGSDFENLSEIEMDEYILLVNISVIS
ncbi:MAG: class I tRNA ligase family protein [Cytophagaceae bacterium]|nr:class I tRNA ligase family protein [Cytophagaceae bacterium]MBL0325508.1 class I tRNA ligase family protein [Cytophagaceae bacterium]